MGNLLLSCSCFCASGRGSNVCVSPSRLWTGAQRMVNRVYVAQYRACGVDLCKLNPKS